MSTALQMPHVTNYKCISAEELDKLEAEVEAEIHRGWQPYGALLAFGTAVHAKFVQPMVRYAEFSR